MRWLIALLFIVSPSWAACTAATAPRTGYSFVRTLCIDHTKVGTVNNTDQASFPWVAVYTEADWATVANSGKIQHTVTQSGGASITVPADFVLTSDSAGTTLCTGWEFGKYTATTGAAIIYINCGTVSHSTDTPVYVSYDNASVSTQQYTVSSVWPSFVGVWHLDSLDGSSPFNYADSSSNGGTATTTVNATVAGIIGLAVDDTSGSTANTPVYTGGAGLPTGTTTRTFEAWYNTQGTGCGTGTGAYGVMGYGGNGSNQEVVIACFGLSNHGLGIDYGGANAVVVLNNTDSNFHQLAGVLSGTTVSTTAFYVDGSDAGAAYNSGGNTVATTAASFTIGNYALNNFRFKGYIDEARISNVVRSADYIRTEYNNINSPGTFSSISAAASATPPPPFGIINQ